MRRHPPRLLQLAAEDKLELERLLRDGRVQQRIARRARVLLAMTSPQTVVQALAAHVAMSCHGIWYLCRRYEERRAWLRGRVGCPAQWAPARDFPPWRGCKLSNWRVANHWA